MPEPRKKKKTVSRQPVYIDLFAGCGGLSLGLRNAGWKGLFAIEKSPDAFNTLKHNLIDRNGHFRWPSWLPKQHHDIKKVLTIYDSQLRALQGKVDLVVGGPPCQGFSTAGLREETDVRNGLIKSYLKFIRRVKPKMIFFENVKGFTLEFQKHKTKGMAYSDYVVRVLRRMGYNVAGEMVDFSKFGIPQKRTRFILVGIRKDLSKDNNSLKALDFFSLLVTNKLQFLREKNLPVRSSLNSAISDLLQKHGTDTTKDRKSFLSGRYSEAKTKYQKFLRRKVRRSIADSHSFANHTNKVQERFQYILDHQIPNRNLSKSLRKKLRVNKHTVILLGSTVPAPTMTTLPDDFIHYKEARILTVREIARLQSFPDWFEFKGKYTTGGSERTKEVPRYTQVGNAIPPLFGEQSGKVLKMLLHG